MTLFQNSSKGFSSELQTDIDNDGDSMDDVQWHLLDMTKNETSEIKRMKAHKKDVDAVVTDMKESLNYLPTKTKADGIAKRNLINNVSTGIKAMNCVIALKTMNAENPKSVSVAHDTAQSILSHSIHGIVKNQFNAARYNYKQVMCEIKEEKAISHDEECKDTIHNIESGHKYIE
eukprot:295296_1